METRKITLYQAKEIGETIEVFEKMNITKWSVHRKTYDSLPSVEYPMGRVVVYVIEYEIGRPPSQMATEALSAIASPDLSPIWEYQKKYGLESQQDLWRALMHIARHALSQIEEGE